MAKQINNLHATAYDNGGRIAIVWDDAEGNRYHYWTTPEIVAPHGYMERPIIYKNPPLSINFGEPGYFKTRKMGVRTAAWAKTVAAIVERVKTERMIEKAMEEAAAEDRASEAARAAAALERRKQKAGPELFEALLRIAHRVNVGAGEDNLRIQLLQIGAAARKALSAAIEDK